MSGPERKKAEACWLSKPVIEKLAEDVAKQIQYDPGGDLEPILEKLGGSLVIKDFWDLSDTDSGSIDIRDSGDFDIYVSNLTSALRDRFTIAHEIGHYILHYLYLRKLGRPLKHVYATRYGSDREEWEANWFAAAFLMPESKFKEVFEGNSRDVSAVAQHFCVSRKAAEVRAKTLGLL